MCAQIIFDIRLSLVAIERIQRTSTKSDRREDTARERYRWRSVAGFSDSRDCGILTDVVSVSRADLVERHFYEILSQRSY